LKFAAIDIGSNAVRLLLSKVIEDGGDPIFKKESFVRMPLRLGEDTFGDGRISDDKTERLIETMLGYGHLIKAYPARDFVAYATSAMREAQNGEDVVRQVKERSGIDITIINGKMEAEVIFANHIEALIGPTENYVYVDVGGGSTELNVVSGGKVIASGSVNIGSVRMLSGGVKESAWKEMKAWLKEKTAGLKSIYGIGTGGNINKIFKLARIKEGKPISYGLVRELYEHLGSHTFEERISKLGLRPDRADVIVLASEIYLSVMKWAKIKKMYVPQIGLADGTIRILYDRFKGHSPSAGEGLLGPQVL
jgi:exopolyphosphatase/guanosine-5'-triphosphate,3'-diphosphate pyrophosphatase